MAEPEDDNSTNEDRFGRQNHQRYNQWSSLLAVVVVLIVVGLVYYFLLK
jgi:cytoskeletal protein RodZ